MGQLNMDALTHLNFLKLTPLKNWLDYIVDLNKFVEYLNEKKGKIILLNFFYNCIAFILSCPGTNDLFELADQFIEKSMSAENEAIQLEEKKFDASKISLQILFEVNLRLR
jgi:hypothetical protein